MFYQETLLFQSQPQHNYRIPSLVAAEDGTILAFCNDRKTTLIDHADNTAVVYACKKPGEPWSEVRTLSDVPDWTCMLGSAVVDSAAHCLFVTAERYIPRNEFGEFTDEEIEALQAKMEAKARAEGVCAGPILFVSRDGGATWAEEPMRIQTRPFTTPEGKTISIGGSCHGSAHGIQLRHGPHAGRLLCPSRIYTDHYSTWDDAVRCCFNNSVYSDDHGHTWHACAPVQQGTGEGTLIERGDGSILYNSRGMYQDQKRYLATSTDGGETWQDFRTDPFLFEEKAIGCNASFLRVEKDQLPELTADAITLFANPRAENRTNMTICVSHDDVESWIHTRCVWPLGSAYSSLDYDPVSRHFFLLYEKGSSCEDAYGCGLAVAEFDLEWLMSDK